MIRLEPIFMPAEGRKIRRLDSVLQAALLLRLSEQGRARDYYYELLDKVDGRGERLDAFTFGAFDAFARAYWLGTDALPLLLYTMKLDEFGPGSVTVDAAENALRTSTSAAMSRYVDLGRHSAVRALEGTTPSPGCYAESLLLELTQTDSCS